MSLPAYGDIAFSSSFREHFMNTKFLIPWCVAVTMLAACGDRNQGDETATPPATTTTPGAPAETPPAGDTPPPADTAPSAETPPAGGDRDYAAPATAWRLTANSEVRAALHSLPAWPEST